MLVKLLNLSLGIALQILPPHDGESTRQLKRIREIIECLVYRLEIKSRDGLSPDHSVLSFPSLSSHSSFRPKCAIHLLEMQELTKAI
jgi:hypothetical protein